MKKLQFLASILTAALLCALMLILPTSAEVYSGTCGAEGDDVNWALNTTTGVLEITGNGAIDDYYDRSPWYSYRSSIKTLKIANGVTSIGDAAFEGCTALTSVTIGNSVTGIGAGAFCDCTALTDITLGNSVTNIGTYAFECCDSLTSIIFPDSVITIADGAFSSCRGLTTVTIGNNVASIGEYAFDSCDALTSITIPGSVTSIGKSALDYCFSLSDITVASNNNHYSSIDGNLYTKDQKTLLQYAIGKSATAFVIPDSVTSIGDRAFYFCENLTSITVPNRVTGIGDQAFASCSALTAITIPNNVTHLGKELFYFCESLKTISLPSALESVGNGAFDECSALTQAYYHGTDADWNEKVTVGRNNEPLLNALTFGHLYGEWQPNDDAQHQSTCSVCGLAKYENHAWNNGVVTVSPTVDAEGVKTYTCIDCGKTKAATIERLPAGEAPNQNETPTTGKAPETETASKNETAPGTDNNTADSNGQKSRSGCFGTISGSAGMLILLSFAGSGLMVKKKED